VYSYRLQAKKNNKRMLRPGVQQWKLFVQDVDGEVRSSGGVLLVTDLHDYFEWVYTSRMRRTISALCAEAGHTPTATIDAVCALVRKWSPTGGRGLPQNQDPSSFLANIYLHEIDAYMLAQGYNYFRFVDEFRVICDSEYEARHVLKKLILALRRLGLSVNVKKTAILHRGTPQYAEFVPPPNREIDEIESLVRSGTVGDLRRALPKLRKFTLRLIADNKAATREFRFCMNRIETIARSRHAKSTDLGWIVDPAIDVLFAQPWATDGAVRVLERLDLTPAQIRRVADLMQDPRVNIYEWQGFNLWRLLAVVERAGRCEPGRMRDCAHNTLCGHWERPMKAGAAYYLGACGTEQDRMLVARAFHRMRHSRLVARSVVLATQELPSAYLEKHVRPYLGKDLRMSLERLRALPSAERYYEPAPVLSTRDVYGAMPEAETS
jgi:hypothetical protein